jgi:phage portal protein BeeE
MGILFVTYGIMTHIVRLESSLTQLLPRPQFVKINPAGLMRADLSSRYAAYAVGRTNGWLSVNDIRSLEDLPPVDGGDVYLTPLNMVPLTNRAPGFADGMKDELFERVRDLLAA